ncbi:MAG: hypothetical protein AAGK74_03330 [Chloroflexota bacterium]
MTGWLTCTAGSLYAGVFVALAIYAGIRERRKEAARRDAAREQEEK